MLLDPDLEITTGHAITANEKVPLIIAVNVTAAITGVRNLHFMITLGFSDS